MKEPTKLPKALLEHIPWEAEANPIWPATSFILRRNLSKYIFPAKMTEGQYHQTLDLIKNCLLSSKELEQPVLLKAEETSALDKEFLFEHFLCMEGFQNTLAGQAFVVDNTSRFLGMVNIEDHLQMQLIDCSGNWESAWNKINQIETSMSRSIEFAFSPRFGYLSSDQFLCGTGLTVLIYLHLPALIHTGQLQETLVKQKDEAVIATGMQGTLDEIVGDIIVLRNHFTLGLSEENILQSLHSMTMKLMALEKTLRSHLQQGKNVELKDHVSRAYGLLLHSYQLQTKEALDALSMIKLGLDLGWIEGITDQKLNEIFFHCRRAHLLHSLPEILVDPAEISRKRTEYLYKQMQGIQLKTES